MYCGNDCNGNPFCGEASKKIGVESVFAAQIISILNAVKSSEFQNEIT